MESEQTGMQITQAGGAAVARQEDGPEQVTSLVQLAIEKGVDVAVLERLVALQERVTERNARGAYFDALATCQEEMPQIHKSKKVDYASNSGARVSYNYAPLEEITRAIRPVLKKHGLSYSWDVDSTEGGVMIVACTLRHVDGHSERSTFPVPVDTRAKMSAAQAHGAALTYGKRQSLVAVLGLTTADDDVDGRTPVESLETITAEQVAALDDIADEAGADKAAFCRFLGVPSLAEIPTHRFDEARAALNAKLAKKNGGAS